jgi:hypothetical protein
LSAQFGLGYILYGIEFPDLLHLDIGNSGIQMILTATFVRTIPSHCITVMRPIRRGS